MKYVLTLLFLGGVAAQDAPPVPSIHWREDLSSARKEARRSKKPMLVVFRCVP